MQYWCDYGFDLNMGQNHVKAPIIEFVVHVAVEIILQNCLKNSFCRMVTQQINNLDRYQTDLCSDNLNI